jgi:hypothetical protein
MSALVALNAGSLFAGNVRLFVAPVERSDALPVEFDPAQSGRFEVAAPPTGWIDAGSVLNFERVPGAAVIPVRSGAPATVKAQSRSALEEEVRFTFPSWNRIAIVLSGGVQTMNLLKTATGASANPSGGVAVIAEPVLAATSAAIFELAETSAVQAGDVIVVDVDYASTTGYIGSGAAGTFVTATAIMPDANYIRRVSLNVARVLSVNAGVVTLASPLLAGVPTTSMKVAVVEGFTDRTGGAYLPEWSALLVMDGVQGDRLLLHYPRLQPVGASASEVSSPVSAGIDRWRPCARLRALPVTDATDGSVAICFRTYLPAPMRLV